MQRVPVLRPLVAVVLAVGGGGGLAMAAAAPRAGAAPVAAASSAAHCPWLNPTLSPDRRARMVVARMTLAQKVSELYGRGDITHYGAANDIPAIPSLCVPEQVSNDAGAGLGDGQLLVTAFPDGIAQAASWDPAMQYEVGAAIGWEAWHKGVDVQLAPGVDIARNPLNGRTFEYAGEDPYLSGQTGAAEIRGIQSQHVAATVKHYAMNDQETNRMTDSSMVDVRTMQEIHLPAYEAAVKQGHVAAVMCAYNRINGVYACQNRYLLRTVLDKQFGFKGWVMSDWGGTHSTVAAAKNGLDQEQNITSGMYFSKALMTAVQQHQVSMATLDEMVTRVMRGLFAVGVFDDPPPPDPQAATAFVNTAQEKALSAQAAEGGAVLLKDSRNALPLHGAGQSIAVIGLPATPAGAQIDYEGGGSSKVPLYGVNPNVVDPLSAITGRAEADGDTVIPAAGATIADAVAAAKLAKTAVVFIADGETEGVDRKSLNAVDTECTLACLPPVGPDQNALVAAVAAANPNTIVVVQAGGPIAMPWLKQVRGVLDMWYPGEQDGNVAAALLFGDVNPSGKLPLTFPKSMKQSPIRSASQWPGITRQNVPYSTYSERLLVGYRWYDAKHLTPLFPFGFGLSYTKFAFSHLTLHTTKHGTTARFAVTNTGSRAGSEVAQLYVADPPAAHEPPKQLKGYQKVSLEPGERQWVELSLDRRSFAYWNTKANGWRVAPGCYTVKVGGSSAQLPLRAKVCRSDIEESGRS
ncbi:MAG TPA: glycoside hydrolase family 3 C-terminal domain-containing protein [Mycobacteriales bacterium]|nr:glycoside hydrolase family 3 C-terminal domain-containing protein [Mycobacteriales bacterium]